MRFSIWAIIISTIGIVAILRSQYLLGIDYGSATGKTQALYGLNQLKYIEFVYYGGFALIFVIVSIIRKEKMKWVVISTITSIIAITLPFLSIWKLWA